jgi:homoserine dehydrogenase
MTAVEAKTAGLAMSTDDPSSTSHSGDVRSILALLELANKSGLENVILADVTALDGLEVVIDRALELGYRLAMANKKALAGNWRSARSYFNHPHLRYESTVGGGQPVISTLRYLLDVNDPIHQIQGQLSGTLGFICSRLDTGTPFSEAVARAKAKGFTEPDPREDLSGEDVRRKVMILGRMAGWPLEAADIEVESLFPSELEGLSVADFMGALDQLDDQIRTRVASAREAGCVLRYVAEVTEGRGSIGLKLIGAESPLANLKYVSFRTERYDDEPLLIGGKGAGVEMTAAGVLGDMVNLVRES